MLKNTFINRQATKLVAKALGELNDRVVYVGGAIVSLYIDDEAALDVRPTKDVDISLEIASLGELEVLRNQLIQKGFYQSSEDQVICRFRYKDVKVDVMATKSIGWAPGNIWFEKGFHKARSIELDDMSIRLLSLPYFIATKFSAFSNRGGIDPRTSHDFEDIVYLLNYTSYFKNEMVSAEKDIRMYLNKQFARILKDDVLQEAVLANLYYEERGPRYERIIKLLRNIVDGT